MALDGTYLLQLPSEKTDLQCVEVDAVRLAAVLDSGHDAGAADLAFRVGRFLEVTGEPGFAVLDHMVELIDHWLELKLRVWDPLSCNVSDWVRCCWVAASRCRSRLRLVEGSCDGEGRHKTSYICVMMIPRS